MPPIKHPPASMTNEEAHSHVAHMDAASTLPEREPVRVLATTPTAILGVAGAIVALGVGDVVLAIILALAIAVVCGLLELVRARVTPAPALAPHGGEDQDADAIPVVPARRVRDTPQA